MYEIVCTPTDAYDLSRRVVRRCRDLESARRVMAELLASPGHKCVLYCRDGFRSRRYRAKKWRKVEERRSP